jgi:hypothetical protein
MEQDQPIKKHRARARCFSRAICCGW